MYDMLTSESFIIHPSGAFHWASLPSRLPLPQLPFWLSLVSQGSHCGNTTLSLKPKLSLAVCCASSLRGSHLLFACNMWILTPSVSRTWISCCVAGWPNYLMFVYYMLALWKAYISKVMVTVFQHLFRMTCLLNKHWNLVISYQPFLFSSCRQLFRIIVCPERWLLVILKVMRNQLDQYLACCV